MNTPMRIAAILPVMLLSACVSSGKFEAAVAEKDELQASLYNAQDEIARNQLQLKESEQEIARIQAEIKQKEQDLEQSRLNNAMAEDELTRNWAKIKKTEQELAQTKQQVDTAHRELADLEAKQHTMQQGFQDSMAQLAALKSIEAETQRRNEIYAEFIDRLKDMIDGGQLTVSIEQGRIVINLPNNILFESGSATLNSEGSKALSQLAAVLSQFNDRRFQVEGHTDNKSINTARFPSNWELSTARALSVVHLLTSKNVLPENISAAGYGEFRPRADNETEEGRQLNRRIEIIMQPNLDILSDELPKVAP